ncbi:MULTISPECIES: DUF3892 domain-containing protein [Heyndrickxia]|uniref:DUF3892 domain-containing protein n=1 Tax=Heyndrickxia TaxID=2837504 RepID=UPI001B10F699|nr:DUF3892 domain-containing protein [Heyndrickxia oleronia]GIN41019.1 hypothetical protein J19TS1_39680 [Heyndrickxia oleronia]
MSSKNFEEIYEQYKQQGAENSILENENRYENEGKEEIIAVRKNEDGDIIAIKTKQGRELDYVTALEEAKSGKLAHVDVFHKYGRDILRSEPDGIKENNLDELPQF